MPRRRPARTAVRHRPPAPRARPPRPPGRPRRDAASSRQRLLDAAAAEFAAHGFAGASVDRIAAAAGLNKAMIYYHFASKAGLYGEILRDMFGAVSVEVRAVAASSEPPPQKIRAFVEAIAREAEDRPHFPPIWFREIAEGGAHLDAAVLRILGGIVGSLASIVEEGVHAGRFVRVDPLVIHAAIVAPLLLFFASRGVRGRLERAGLPGATAVTRQMVVGHVQRMSLAALEGRL
ncbi:MAG TPA: TetR/AcrR family transcriptional regulator [Vicinamibacterales bacterium]|nr:TetR/AcrR family transcriptional regulator [Vicinamibacterales bacterium]